MVVKVPVVSADTATFSVNHSVPEVVDVYATSTMTPVGGTSSDFAYSFFQQGGPTDDPTAVSTGPRTVPMGPPDMGQ